MQTLRSFIRTNIKNATDDIYLQFGDLDPDICTSGTNPHTSVLMCYFSLYSLIPPLSPPHRIACMGMLSIVAKDTAMWVLDNQKVFFKYEQKIEETIPTDHPIVKEIGRRMLFARNLEYELFLFSVNLSKINKKHHVTILVDMSTETIESYNTSMSIIGYQLQAVNIVSSAMNRAFGISDPGLDMLNRNLQLRGICATYGLALLWFRSFHTFAELARIMRRSEELETFVAEIRSHTMSMFINCLRTHAPKVYETVKDPTKTAVISTVSEDFNALMDVVIGCRVNANAVPVSHTVQLYINSLKINIPVRQTRQAKPRFGQSAQPVFLSR